MPAPVLGDFISAAWRALDDQAGWAGTDVPGRDVAEVAAGLRRLTAVADRYAGDVVSALGAMAPRVRQAHQGWERAAPDVLAALACAAAALDDGEPVTRLAGRRPACPLARRLDAAARSLTAGRDLLQVHFAGRERTGGHRSGWAPVIASPQVSTALLADIAALGGRAARLVARMPDPYGWIRHEADRSRLTAGCRWLAEAEAISRAARLREPVSGADRELLYAIPASRLPGRPVLRAGMPVAGLCAAITASAQRAGHAAWLAAGLGGDSPDISVTSWRQIAASGIAASHHIRMVLDRIAFRAEELGHLPARRPLATASLAARHGRLAWERTARALDPVTTEVRGHLSPAAAEAADLALLTGRLAYAGDRWNLSALVAGRPRAAAELVPGPGDLPEVVAAVHYAADGLARLAEASRAQVGAATRRGRVLAPARTAGIEGSTGGAFRPAPAGLAVSLMRAADGARSASAHTAATVGAAAVAAGAPSRRLAAARRAASAAHRAVPGPASPVLSGSAAPEQRRSRSAQGAPGSLEARLRDLGASPSLVERAMELDQQGQRILAKAAADRLSLPAPAPEPVSAQSAGARAGPHLAQHAPSAQAELEAGQ